MGAESRPKHVTSIMENLRSRLLKGQDDRFLKSTGLSDLANTAYYAHPDDRERQQKLRDIFLSEEGKDLLKRYYTETSAEGLARQTYESMQLKFKLENLMPDFSDFPPEAIDPKTISFYILSILKLLGRKLTIPFIIRVTLILLRVLESINNRE